MYWTTTPDEERLRLWKDLRHDIREESLEEKLKVVAKFISTMPFGARSLDYYDPASWPTPWEILFHGSFCLSSISLLSFYTLALVTDESVKIELELIDDLGDVYLIPVIEDQFVLNYETGLVSSYPEISKEIKVLKRYTRNDIKII